MTFASAASSIAGSPGISLKVVEIEREADARLILTVNIHGQYVHVNVSSVPRIVLNARSLNDHYFVRTH